MDSQKFPNRSEASNARLLLVVDKASKIPVVYPLPSEEAHGVASLLVNICLIFGYLRILGPMVGGSQRVQ